MGGINVERQRLQGFAILSKTGQEMNNLNGFAFGEITTAMA